MTRKIIGFTGLKGSGKTTAAQTLIDEDYVCMSFADPVREMLIPLFGVFGIHRHDAMQLMTDPAKKEQIVPGIGKSPRKLMQTLGIEWGRNSVSGSLWLDAMRRNLEKHADIDVVFDDVRFDNEAEMIRSLGGSVVFIRRSKQAAAENNDGYHKSEAGIVWRKGDLTILNDYSVAGLRCATLHATGLWR